MSARAAVIAAAVAAVAAGVFVATRLVTPPAVDAPAAEIGGYVLDRPREIPAFELIDGSGQPFRTEDFEGRWSFLYFGYTYCPDVCPLSMVELASVKEHLQAALPDAPVDYYLVSVDPARDTPERVGEYAAYFDPNFRGLTGPLAEIDKLAKAAAVVYVIPEAEEGEPYEVGHSSTFTLVDPEARIRAIFTSPFEAERIAADFERIVYR